MRSFDDVRRTSTCSFLQIQVELQPSHCCNHDLNTGYLFAFVARQHTVYAQRDIAITYHVRLSVCSSVRSVPVLCLSEWTYRHTFDGVVGASC